MAYIKTDNEKDKIFKNDKNKLREEIKAKQKELGLRNMIPRHNQDEYQQLKDMENEKNHILEQMSQAKEDRIKKQEAERKAKKKSFNEMLRLYLKKQERQNKQEYDARRINYLDGGFDEYESIIKMFALRILLKEIKKDNVDDNGIILQEDDDNKNKEYEIINFGEGCEDISVGEKVMVIPYSGIEIVSKKDVYRIVFINDILCKLD